MCGLKNWEMEPQSSMLGIKIVGNVVIVDYKIFHITIEAWKNRSLWGLGNTKRSQALKGLLALMLFIKDQFSSFWVHNATVLAPPFRS